jgi:hypothetical protein
VIRSDVGFYLDYSVTDATARKHLDGKNQQAFHKIQYKFDLITTDAEKTPHLFDFTLVYQEIENDLGN